MGSRTTIEVAVRFREPSWIIASGGGIGRTCGLDVGILLRIGHSKSIVSGTRDQLRIRDGTSPLLDPSQSDSVLPVVNDSIWNIRCRVVRRRARIEESSTVGLCLPPTICQMCVCRRRDAHKYGRLEATSKMRGTAYQSGAIEKGGTEGQYGDVTMLKVGWPGQPGRTRTGQQPRKEECLWWPKDWDASPGPPSKTAPFKRPERTFFIA
jgi:hypothetical protein